MKILVKLGGTLLDSPESRAALAAQITGARGRGVELVVVHGGGGLGDLRASQQGVFDFAQFDALSAQFDLSIGAA